MGVPENSVHEPPISDKGLEDAKTIENDQLPPARPQKQQHHPLSAIPKRKPLAQATVVAVAGDDSVEELPSNQTPRRELRVGKLVIPIPFADNKRKQYILAGIVGVVILIALIIGLAVGLTGNK